MTDDQLKILKAALSHYGETLRNMGGVFELYSKNFNTGATNEYWNMVEALAKVLGVDEFDICEY